MIKISDIERTVATLPLKKLAQFRRWFEKFDAARWDKEFEEDVKSGKLNHHAGKALKDFRNGSGREL